MYVCVCVLRVYTMEEGHTHTHTRTTAVARPPPPRHGRDGGLDGQGRGEAEPGRPTGTCSRYIAVRGQKAAKKSKQTSKVRIKRARDRNKPPKAKAPATTALVVAPSVFFFLPSFFVASIVFGCLLLPTVCAFGRLGAARRENKNRGRPAPAAGQGGRFLRCRLESQHTACLLFSLFLLTSIDCLLRVASRCFSPPEMDRA